MSLKKNEFIDLFLGYRELLPPYTKELIEKLKLEFNERFKEMPDDLLSVLHVHNEHPILDDMDRFFAQFEKREFKEYRDNQFQLKWVGNGRENPKQSL